MKKINSKYQQRWSQSHFYLILFFLDSCFFFFNKSYYHCLDYSLPPLNFQQIQSESRRMVDSFDAVCKESLIPPGCPNEILNRGGMNIAKRAEGACREQPVLRLFQGSCLPFSCREHCELSQFSRGVPPISASRRLSGLLDHAWVEIYVNSSLMDFWNTVLSLSQYLKWSFL